jgi:hypothetical protein
LAHTNSIGYVSDASGNVTFYYGTYHYTSFNEAELKLEGANGTSYTTTITQFNELSSTTPNGLFPGVNYFTTDGTSLIAYSDSVAAGGQSNTWQGLTFSGLAAGDYTFTYIPLGNTESYQPNGTPTMDWAPWDEVIRTYTVTLNSALLSGDANQNGILDSLETSPASNTVTAPTVTSQGSSSVVGYIAVTGGVVQVVSRTQTDTTWDNMSDGTTANTQVTNTTLTPFEGRVDQAATAQDVVGSTLRNLDFNNIQGIRMNSKYDNGMSGSTTGAVVGGTKELENGVSISGGFTRLGTGLTGNGDSVDAETTAFAAGVEKNNVKLEVRRATTDYEVSRTIGTFSNSSETSGADTSARITYSPDTGKINPIFGYTRGKRTMDGYTETGSIQSARTVDATSEMYGYGTVGLRGDLGLVDFTAMHHTDGVNDISIGLEKETDTVTWRIEGTRSMTDLGNTNAISAGLVINF